MCESIIMQMYYIVEYTGNIKGIIPGGINEGNVSFLGKKYSTKVVSALNNWIKYMHDLYSVHHIFGRCIGTTHLQARRFTISHRFIGINYLGIWRGDERIWEVDCIIRELTIRCTVGSPIFVRTLHFKLISFVMVFLSSPPYIRLKLHLDLNFSLYLKNIYLIFTRSNLCWY